MKDFLKGLLALPFVLIVESVGIFDDIAVFDIVFEFFCCHYRAVVFRLFGRSTEVRHCDDTFASYAITIGKIDDVFSTI